MATPLRIVHCFRSPVGGIFRHVRDLVDAQEAAGHAIGILCDSTTGGDFEAKMFDALAPKVRLGIHRTPMQRHVGFGDLASAWRSFAIARAMRPDVLHGHGAKGGVYSRAFGTMMRAGGRRVARIYSPHGGSLHYDETALTGRAFFLAERMMDRFSDHILFVSDHERRTYVRKVGEPRSRNRLIHNGLRREEFEPVNARPDAADFVYVGMMRDLKGPDLFIEALAEAERRTGRDLTAAMVGDGDDLQRYREMTEGFGLGERVAFHPAMPARRAFALGRTMVVPSRAEALPYIVLEALAAGRPMIATAVGGIPEIFGAGSPALVEPRAESIGAAMAAVLADEAAYAAKMPSVETLRRRFGAETMAAAVEAAYRESLA